VPAVSEVVRIWEVIVVDGEYPITFVQVTPLVPASHYKLYEVIDDPPLSGEVNATHETYIYVEEVEDPFVGAAIALGTVITVAPAVLTLEYEPHPAEL
jgi:hypothetical protein